VIGLGELQKGQTMKAPQVLIINLGSQYTDLIDRSLRDFGVRSAILPPARANDWLRSNTPKAIILSGSDASVNDPDPPAPPEVILTADIPILGICYGMQWLAKRLGGQVISRTGKGNYGRTEIHLTHDYFDQGLLDGLLANWLVVHASHGDVVTHLPPGFTRIAWPETSTTAGVMAMVSSERKMWGVQFHPEVHETQHGSTILSNFVLRIAGCEKDWNPRNLADEIREETLHVIGDRNAIIGFSGGVDSTTLTALMAPSLGNRLRAVTIDGGQLREGEILQIIETAKSAGVFDRHSMASAPFVRALSDTLDAEEKRKRFRVVYRDAFQTLARGYGASVVMQGSLAPDFIESGATGGANIASHHNVGLTFDGLDQVHPFRGLFKYEVRALGQELGLPADICTRQPFPGPGLFVRIVGAPVTEERLALLRLVDRDVTYILQASGEYQQMSQLVVALLCVNTAGVRGDGRSYKPTIAIRGLVTSDFMTGRGFQIKEETRRKLTRTLLRNPEVGNVGYFEADKPPCRTEFE